MNYLYLEQPIHKNNFSLDKIEGLNQDDLLVSIDGTIVGINEKMAISSKEIRDIRAGYSDIKIKLSDIKSAEEFYKFLSIIGFE